jgi:glutamate--cysteine ligase catalytic subunit
MAPLEEGDDGYGVKFVSMFERAADSSPRSQNVTTDVNGDVYDDDGVSIHRRQTPFAPGSSEENSYEEMTMGQIMCGKGDYFPGLIPLIHAYLDYIHCDSVTRQRLNTYLRFIEQRAVGELVTPATWMRGFVRGHPAYRHDSVVSDEIAYVLLACSITHHCGENIGSLLQAFRGCSFVANRYDLLVKCKEIGEGKVHVPELLGGVRIDPITAEAAYEVKLDTTRARNDRLVDLLRRYTSRRSFRESFVTSSAAAGGSDLNRSFSTTLNFDKLNVLDYESSD